MKIVFLGATKFSQGVLDCLLNNNFSINAVFAIPEKFCISYNNNAINHNYSNIEKYCVDKNIPAYIVNGEEGKKITDYKNVIATINPDIILVAGWYYNVPKSIRDLATAGAWGLHASLLPAYAGGAPLVWAIIEGQTETGVTLFKLSDEIDGGDIIAQKKFDILFTDTIKEVYDKAEKASKEMIVETLLKYPNINYTKQDISLVKMYPQRNPNDGEIHLNMTGEEMYNFIRAQASPYPGAFIKTKDGKKIIIDKARLD